MPLTVFEIKERLVRVIDDNGIIRDMTVASDVISLLEKISVSKEDLEKTRLGRYVNIIRKAAKDASLAKRAKNLIKSWQQLIKQGNSQLPPSRTRPETPNSVGSSPSPPDVGMYNVKYVSKAPPVFPQNHQTSVNSETLIKKSKKTKDGTTKVNKGNRKKLKSPLPGTVTSERNVISPELKKLSDAASPPQNDKKSPGCGQHTVSVVNQNKNGIKLTFKMQNSSSANVEDESEINVTTTGNGSQKWREDMLERTQNDKLKENKKKHKKKKSRSRSSDRSSPPSRTPQTATPAPRQNTHEDMYNNNKNISGIITSQSESNLTVMSSSKKLLSKPISSPDLKNHNSQPTIDSSPSQVNNSLKRKREQSMVNHNSSSPELTSLDDRPRNKERRMTLTYDPHTRQLQQIEKRDSSPSTSETTSPLGGTRKSLSPKSTEVLLKQKPKLSPAKVTATRNRDPAILTATPEITKTEQEQLPQDDDKFPTKLVPSVSLNGESSKPPSTQGGCRRGFEKRKARRKNDVMELQELFPISDSVTFDSTDSETEDAGGFCSSLSEEKTDVGQWTGVSGCRGNNGNWYDWLEMFCVRNNDDDARLPEEEEVLPLHILPYIELD